MLTQIEQQIMDFAAEKEATADPEFYGFLVARGIQERTGMRLLTAHGTLYNALYRLERMGHLESRWETPEIAEQGRRPRRRLYRRTRRAGPGDEGE